MIHALVIFQYDKTGGWRVRDFEPINAEIRPLPLHQFSFIHGGKLLGVCGTFRHQPRRGTWCKHPHKELIHA
jgi:hypothetical protein